MRLGKRVGRKGGEGKGRGRVGKRGDDLCFGLLLGPELKAVHFYI